MDCKAFRSYLWQLWKSWAQHPPIFDQKGTILQILAGPPE